MKTQVLFWDDSAALAAIVRSLQQGGVVVGSSDTVLGLLAAVTQEGFQALNAIKARADKPYLVLIDSPIKVTYFAKDIPEYVQKLMKQCWPGPLTIIVNVKDEVPAYACSAERAIALRVPAHQGLLAVAAQFNGLFSTSANLTGKPVPATLADVDASIMQAAAYAIMDRLIKHDTVPSTIVDCTGPVMKVVREGAYPVDQLQLIVDSK